MQSGICSTAINTTLEVAISFPHPACNLCQLLQVLTFKSVGPLILGNTLQLLSFVRHKDKELVAKVADRACRCLDEADGHLLVTILKAVTDMKMEHKIMRVGELIKQEQHSFGKLGG